MARRTEARSILDETLDEPYQLVDAVDLDGIPIDAKFVASSCLIDIDFGRALGELSIHFLSLSSQQLLDVPLGNSEHNLMELEAEQLEVQVFCILSTLGTNFPRF